MPVKAKATGKKGGVAKTTTAKKSKEQVELVPVLKEEEEKQNKKEAWSDSDVSDSDASEEAQEALLAGIIDVKGQKSAPKRKVIPVDDREKDIESLLFGGSSNWASSDPLSHSSSSSEDETDEQSHGDSDSDEEEGESSFVMGLEAEKMKQKLKEEMGPAKKKKKLSEERMTAAWSDEEDDEERISIVRSNRARKLRKVEGETNVTGSQYQERLREQHAKIGGEAKPKWAQVSEEKEEDASGTLKFLASTNALVSSGREGDSIPVDKIRVGAMTDANKTGVSKSAVGVVTWHPNGSILLTAGLDKTLRLFDVDGLKNAKLQSAHFAELPITSAVFSADGNEIYLVGLHHSIYVYDILSARIDRIDRLMGAKEEKFKCVVCDPTGQYVLVLGGKGRIHVVSSKTKQWIKTLKITGAVTTAVFSPDGSRLYTGGKRGEIYVWNFEKDARTPNTLFACLRRFNDEGNGATRSLAISPDSSFLAIGQDSGIVNIYKIHGDGSESFHSISHPKPIKSIMNLTTTVSLLQFNHDSQLLAIASHTLANKIRLVHIPSFRVYQNWPSETTKIGRISSLAFSPDSNWIALGTARGNVKLFKLHHYHPASLK